MQAGDVDTVGPPVCHWLVGESEHVGAGAQLVAQLQAPCGEYRSVSRAGPLNGHIQPISRVGIHREEHPVQPQHQIGVPMQALGEAQGRASSPHHHP